MAQKKVQPNNDLRKEQFVFGKINYRLMLFSFAVVVLGFILMIGKEDIYDFRKIVIAPIVVIAGFAMGFIAILKKPDQN